jgi:hypothetical protein
MMTAMLSAKNVIAGENFYDPWMVNEDAEYHEGEMREREQAASGLRSVPQKVSSATAEG